ncbi:MAG TPA: hypothetical protein VF192_05265 [Longimicrobiales bacterium]
MGRWFGGGGLLLLALFMLVGFLRADVDASAPATLVAVLIGVGLPAFGGVALIARPGARRRLARRREELRRQTLEAEVLRLAGRHGGRLTVVEVVTELAVDADDAKQVLDALMVGGLAEIEVTDSGMLVYTFRDVASLPHKSSARGLLE